jgi:intracellular septation protein
MKDFLEATKLLLIDLASTVLFLFLYLSTHDTILSASLGLALGIGQIGIRLLRRKPINAMEWLSLFLIVASGGASIMTRDPRFVLFKPTAFYAISGFAMLDRGWLNRYLPAIAKEVAADVGVIVGFVWAGLMFCSALVNAVVAMACSVPTWAIVMPLYGIVSKMLVFVCGFAAIRLAVGRRIHAMPAPQREALIRSIAWSERSSAGEPAQGRPEGAGS